MINGVKKTDCRSSSDNESKWYSQQGFPESVYRRVMTKTLIPLFQTQSSHTLILCRQDKLSLDIGSAEKVKVANWSS